MYTDPKMKSRIAQPTDWYLSYDSLAAAAWRRNANTPPNDPRTIVTTDQNDAGCVVEGVAVGCVSAGFVGAELIIC
jgi:hypothetical protein